MSSDLKDQINSLQDTINAERAQHDSEARAASARIRALEEKLKEHDQMESPPKSPSTPPVAKRTTTATKRTTTTTTTTKSSSTGRLSKVAPRASEEPSSPEPSTPPRSGGEAAQASPSSSATKRFSKKSATPDAKSTDKKSSPKATVAADETDTAAQHAWDRFCVAARNEFTVRELSLVSLETLRSLLDHYGIMNPIQAAQIECQWALLQEGRERADSYTPHDARNSNRAKPFQPMDADSNFAVPAYQAKPHLSKRALLGKEEVRTSNLMDSIKLKKSIVVPSKGSLHVEAPALSDPNTSPQRSKILLTGKRPLSGPTSQLDLGAPPRPSGRGRSHSPNPHPVTAYPTEHNPDKHCGVKRFTRSNSSEHRDRGVRVGYSPPNDVRKAESLKVVGVRQRQAGSIVIG